MMDIITVWNNMSGLSLSLETLIIRMQVYKSDAQKISVITALRILQNKILKKCLRCNLAEMENNGYVPLVVNTFRSFLRSWLITGFVTRLIRHVSLVEHELLTLPEHLRSPPVFSGVRVTLSSVLCVCFVDRFLSFCNFLLAIVLSVLRYTDSDYPFGIFKLFWLNFKLTEYT
jgi:hypothetical protein